EWVHVQLHQQKGMISLSPPTICNSAYIVDGLLQMKAKGIAKLSVKSEIIKKHNELVQKHLQTTVFNSGGCKSYYLDANGRNFAAWPWSLKKLKQRLHHLNLEEYDVIYEADLVKVKPKVEEVAG
ncbi:hypothetical protein ABTH08_19005, partial [Acinetobacter baumannii]